MATYKHLRSSTANKRPTTSIADGQLAINTNTASPGLFFKDSAGTGIVKVGPVHVGTTAPNSTPAAGGSTGNYLGEQWLDTSVSPAQMKVWNGSAWIGVVADELPVSKLQDGAARQLLQTDAAGTGVEWTNNVDVPGTLDVTSTATFDSIASHPLGSASAPTITFTGDTNTGIYSPGADQLALATNGTGRLFVDANGNVGVGAAPDGQLSLLGANSNTPRLRIQHPSNDADAAISTYFDGSGTYLIVGSNHYFNSTGSNTKFDATSGSSAWYLDGSGVGIFYNSSGSGSITERLRIRADGTFEIKGGGTAGISPAVSVNPSASANSLVIDSSGRLGVGTSAPDFTLDVNGTVGITEGQAVSWHDGSGTLAARIYASATDELRFERGSGASRSMTIDSSGNVGIGTTSPIRPLSVSNGGAETFEFGPGDSAGTNLTLHYNRSTSTYIGAINQASYHTWSAGGASEKMRLDTSGRLLVGTSSARTNYPSSGGTSPDFQLEGTDADGGTLAVFRNSTSATASAYLALGRSKGSSLGSNTAVASGDRLGAVFFNGADGTNLVSGALIEAYVDGTPGTNDMPGRLVFSTTADGASSPTERMRIKNSGDICIDTVTTYSPSSSFANLTIDGSITAGPNLGALTPATATLNIKELGGTSVAFFYGTTNVGSITNTVSATAYNTSSDYRLKENVVPLTGAADRINQLQVHRFNFIADPDTTVDGFLAHEAQAVVPECVTGTKDEVDDEGKPVYQGIDQSKLVPLLTAALQEALAEIESLKARVTALEP